MRGSDRGLEKKELGGGRIKNAFLPLLRKKGKRLGGQEGRKKRSELCAGLGKDKRGDEKGDIILFSKKKGLGF